MLSNIRVLWFVLRIWITLTCVKSRIAPGKCRLRISLMIPRLAWLLYGHIARCGLNMCAILSGRMRLFPKLGV